MTEPARETRYTGMIIRDGVLQLYEDANDLRADLTVYGRDWSQLAWIEAVVFHAKGQTSTKLGSGV